MVFYARRFFHDWFQYDLVECPHQGASPGQFARNIYLTLSLIPADKYMHRVLTL